MPGLHIAKLLWFLLGFIDKPTDKLSRYSVFPGYLGLADALNHIAMDDINNLGRR